MNVIIQPICEGNPIRFVKANFVLMYICHDFWIDKWMRVAQGLVNINFWEGECFLCVRLLKKIKYLEGNSVKRCC